MSKIFMSLGIPKSASSFLAQLALGVQEKLVVEGRAVAKDTSKLFPGLERGVAGFLCASSALDELGLPRTRQGQDELLALLLEDMAQSNEVIVLKSHLGIGPYVQEAIAQGLILGCASIRHPADGLLSLGDHWRREGKDSTGVEQFKTDGLSEKIESRLASWTATPKLEIFDFTDLVQFPYSVAQRIGNLYGFHAPVRGVVDSLIDNPQQIWQYNQGALNRSAAEISAEQRKEIENFYPVLMDLLKNYVSVRIKPTFAVVIPTLNSESHVGETIHSIASQTGDFNIHLHVQDGGSSDGTVELVHRWQAHLESPALPFSHNITRFTVQSGADTGMYNAIQKGFDTLQADWYGWIGSDNIFLPAAFQTVATLSDVATEFEWVIGSSTEQREDGLFFEIAEAYASAPISQRSIAMGLHDNKTLPNVQQEGVFWRDVLWEKCGRRLPEQFALAGDFALWVQFASVTEPLMVDYPLASFRRRAGQLSEDMGRYDSEVSEVRARINVSEAAVNGTQLQKAIVRYPHGRWAIDHTVASTTFSESMTVESLFPERHPGPTRVEAQTRWELVGAGEWESPVPELGLVDPFCWILKAGTTLRLLPPLLGAYRVTLTVANPHPGQVLFIRGPGVELRESAPNADFVGGSFSVSFECNVGVQGEDFRIVPSIGERTETDPRELAFLLMGVVIERR